MTAKEFFQQMRDRLLARQSTVESQIKQTTDKDPFMQELKEDGYRNLDELGEEAVDEREHDVNQAVKADLVEEKEQIESALNKITQGKYGYCENCGKEIPKERLVAFPTATKCVDCERKSAS